MRGTFLFRRRLGVKSQAPVVRFLETAVPSGELLERAIPRLGIKALRIPLCAGFEGRAHINLVEILADDPRRELPKFPAWRYDRNNHDNTQTREQFGCLGDAPDIFGTVLIREAQVRIQPGAKVVSIENRGEAPSECRARSTALAMVDFPDPERP
jgi:hypothetical protein